MGFLFLYLNLHLVTCYVEFISEYTKSSDWSSFNKLIPGGCLPEINVETEPGGFSRALRGDTLSVFICTAPYLHHLPWCANARVMLLCVYFPSDASLSSPRDQPLHHLLLVKACLVQLMHRKNTGPALSPQSSAHVVKAGV